MTCDKPHHGKFICISDQRRTFVDVYHDGTVWMVKLPRNDLPWSLCRSYGWTFKAVGEPSKDTPGIKRG